MSDGKGDAMGDTVESKAWNWNEVTESFWKEPAAEVYYLASRWRQDKRKKLLDLGCGIGRHAIFFAEQGFTVEATDLSESGVAALAATASDRNLPIKTRIGDMVELSYPTRSFDAVLAFHSIYHTDSAGIESVFSEIERVLVEDGELYVTFNSTQNPSFSDPTNRRIDARTRLTTEGPEVGIPHYYVDAPEIRRLLASFEILRFAHVEEVWGDRSSWHYFVLAKKLAGHKAKA